MGGRATWIFIVRKRPNQAQVKNTDASDAHAGDGRGLRTGELDECLQLGGHQHLWRPHHRRVGFDPQDPRGLQTRIGHGIGLQAPISVR